MPSRTRLLAGAVCALSAASIPVATAPAATRLVVKGAGFGHGVGMSQYGAYGYALHGVGYEEILTHYYTGTQLGTLTTSPEVAVLLRSSATASFTGASRIGDRALDAGKTYSVRSSGGTVVLRSPTGRSLVSWAGPVRAAGKGGKPVKLLGPGPNGLRDASFRGSLEFRPSGGGLLVVNALDLDSYVRGVVAAESPSSWPADALKAQAVAARTYAITTNAGGGQGFTQWADTRSQVYKGVAAETIATDTAVAATSRQVVTYLGKPIVTYFFSTSGGKTEDVENGFPGARAQPYLRGVVDPYDDVSPKHRWGPYRFTLAQAQHRLGSLVKGSLRSVKVTKRGFSPRIVSAQVVGSRGTTTVDGATLRRRFDLFDSWATFTVIGTTVTKPSKPTPTTTPPAAPTPATPGGGAAFSGRSLRAAALSAAPVAGGRVYTGVLRGRIAGARTGDWILVQRRGEFGLWGTAFWTTARTGGAFRATLPGTGDYRIRWRGLLGPDVTAR